MSFLTKEELEALKKHADLAAVAKKLEDGQFIPKDRFDEVNKKAKDNADRLKKLEDERTDAAEKERVAAEKLESERLSKAGEWEKLMGLERVKTADEATKRKQAETELAAEKEVANQHRQYRKERIEVIKTAMGDKWVPEYENFSITSLEKIASDAGHKVDTFTKPPSHQKPEPTDYSKMSGADFAKVEEQARRGQLVKSEEK
ncbi:MAG: hypothetical protein V3W09_04895 [Nitrososphaerales archaeon]